MNTWLWVRFAQLIHFCKEENIPAHSGTTFQTYTIDAGKHRCNEEYFKPLHVRDMYFTVVFDESGIYDVHDEIDQIDTNKLWGLSDGINHMKNSARIGWNYVDGSIRLRAFAHVNGVMKYEEITPIQPGEEVHCSIRIYGRFYFFQAKDKIVQIERATKSNYVDGYQLFPYFGGNKPAPHKITIKIK